MKLHQINLENLNSLYGEHKLDLEGALGDPPLFLIVGPTGSGKSTLMDAVSLALFGVTPRLSGERGQDHREAHHIMSHGTGSCYAEVIFSKLEGGQRARYRARWSCRRAHGRAKGKPQRPQRGLDRLDPETGEWVILCAHDLKKTYGPHFDEVLEGLTVHDFRRSVLLAQGAFAAFIDASEDERAAILERLTETGEYKRLGQRAALWRRQAEQQLQALETQRDKLALLSKPEVEARRAEVEALGEALASATSRVAALRGRATWLREAVVAEEALAAAEAA
ncbi:AAA family ATPase, partial [Myxococcota bacterium]|nr:AAA family ATPase [Myxococcota bacterium]